MLQQKTTLFCMKVDKGSPGGISNMEIRLVQMFYQFVPTFLSKKLEAMAPKNRFWYRTSRHWSKTLTCLKVKLFSQIDSNKNVDLIWVDFDSNITLNQSLQCLNKTYWCLNDIVFKQLSCSSITILK